MNIEIANRLVQLRKANNLSQEDLAEKLGLSRQAVSRWERAEASPDIDNLILLSRLYGVSVDELLKTQDEIPEPETEKTSTSSETQFNEQNTESGEKKKKETVHISLSGIDVEDEDDTVHIGWDGIHVDEKDGDKVVIENGKVIINGEEQLKSNFRKRRAIRFFQVFPFFLIATVIYILCGFFDWLGGWGAAWILFLAVPVLSSILKSIEKRNANLFAYPVFVTLVFFVMGIFYSLWQIAWVVFLTIPIYYGIIKAFKHAKKLNEDNEDKDNEKEDKD